MNRRQITSVLVGALMLATLVIPDSVAQVDPEFDPTGELHARWIDSHGSVSQIDYSIPHDVLAVRNSGTMVRIIDAATGELLSSQFAQHIFVDIDVTPDGNYFFAADFGGVNIGYGTPIAPHYVHRYDIRNNTWTVLEAPTVAGRLEAVSATRVLLQETDQHVDAMLNSYNVDTGEMVELARDGADYNGDMVYDPASGFLFHGNSGSSSSEVHVLRVRGDQLSRVYDTGVYGTAQEGGGSLALSADGQHVFYGVLQLEAADVTSVQLTHPAPIVASTGGFAFTADGVGYSTTTGEERFNLGWIPTAFSATHGGDQFWLASDSGEILKCQAAYDSWGCPTSPPIDPAFCDTVTPTIDMNTNGGNGIGTSGNDVILGTPGDDVIDAGPGNDLVCGMGGNDRIIGHDGADVLIGGDGNDQLFGRAGDDALNGGSGDDVLHGDKGDDFMDGAEGNDKMFGYAGDDVMIGGSGDDRMHGNFGYDFMYGLDGNDVMYGYGDDDFMYGGEGNDTVGGNFGNDTIEGNEGNDRLFGYGDDDTMSGGQGHDLMVGNRGDDWIQGDADDDTLYGSDGNDVIEGGDGDDQLTGNSGDDDLYGEAGSDHLDGGINYDTCDGGSDADTMERCELSTNMP